MSSVFVKGCTFIGFVVVFRFLITLTRAAGVYFLRPGKNLRKLGSWAVVTGATDGIGRALCDVLARKGECCLSRLCCISERVMDDEIKRFLA